MPYEYARMFIALDTTDDEREKMSRTGEALIKDGWKIHTYQITSTGGESTLFERHVEEEVIPPEPMRIR